MVTVPRASRPSVTALLATGALPPVIHVAHYNISPSLGKRLVLELKGGMGNAKGFDQFPCRFLG